MKALQGKIIVSHDLNAHFKCISVQLQALRIAVEKLETEEGHQSLRGHQTVNSSESIRMSFQKLQTAITEMEDTMVMIAEATGAIDKL
jgi:hypothetical protein